MPVPTPLAATLQHLTETPLPLPKTVPDALARAVLRLMAREPENRPASAARARAALEDALRLGVAPPAPEVVEAPPEGLTAPRPVWPWVAAVGASVVAMTFWLWPAPPAPSVAASTTLVPPAPVSSPITSTRAPPTTELATVAPPTATTPPPASTAPASVPRRRPAPATAATAPATAPGTAAETFMLPGAR
jgi:serine/threonine-protein kinase